MVGVNFSMTQTQPLQNLTGQIRPMAPADASVLLNPAQTSLTGSVGGNNSSLSITTLPGPGVTTPSMMRLMALQDAGAPSSGVYGGGQLPPAAGGDGNGKKAERVLSGLRDDLEMLRPSEKDTEVENLVKLVERSDGSSSQELRTDVASSLSRYRKLLGFLKPGDFRSMDQINWTNGDIIEFSDIGLNVELANNSEGYYPDLKSNCAEGAETILKCYIPPIIERIGMMPEDFTYLNKLGRFIVNYGPQKIKDGLIIALFNYIRAIDYCIEYRSDFPGSRVAAVEDFFKNMMNSARQLAWVFEMVDDLVKISNWHEEGNAALISKDKK